MPRRASPVATPSIAGCSIPAPAPWARTSTARAPAGRSKRPDTAWFAPTAIAIRVTLMACLRYYAASAPAYTLAAPMRFPPIREQVAWHRLHPKGMSGRGSRGLQQLCGLRVLRGGCACVARAPADHGRLPHRALRVPSRGERSFLRARPRRDAGERSGKPPRKALLLFTDPVRGASAAAAGLDFHQP